MCVLCVGRLRGRAGSVNSSNIIDGKPFMLSGYILDEEKEVKVNRRRRRFVCGKAYGHRVGVSASLFCVYVICSGL